ncbi:hypothetical protein M569_04884, partial [Genlisea aurea]
GRRELLGDVLDHIGGDWRVDDVRAGVRARRSGKYGLRLANRGPVHISRRAVSFRDLLRLSDFCWALLL